MSYSSTSISNEPTDKLFTSGSKTEAVPQLHRRDCTAEDKSASHRTILIIDDDEAVRSVSARIVRASGYQTLTADNGHDGLEQLKTHAHVIVLVLLDLTMPTMDGSTTLHLIDQIKPGLPVLLMSGYSDYTLIQRLTRRDLTSFISKPFGLNDLQKALEQLLS